MIAAHIVFLVFAGLAGAATVVAGPLLRRTSGGVRLQTVGLITATALVVGNAVCVLPGTPTWYSTVVTTATAAGLAWLVTTVVGALGQANRRRSAGSPVVQSTVVPPAPQPLATVHPFPGVRNRIAPGPVLVTARDLHDVGPEGSRVASSSTVYVAENLDAYVPLSPIARRNRALRGHQRRDPAEAMRRLRVVQAYNNAPAREGRIRHLL